MKSTSMKPIMKVALKALPPEYRKAARRTLLRKGASVREYSGDNPAVLQCAIAYNKYGGYCVPMSTYFAPAEHSILSGEVYEQETIDFIAQNCRGGDIIHAGAFFGDFLPALAQACADGARVWAFEPNPHSYRCALITTVINDLGNVTLTNAGLGAEEGQFPMQVTRGAANKVLESDDVGADAEHVIQVPIVRIDDVVPSDRKVTILQLDVEGFEKPALSGALATIRRNKPILILERAPKEGWLDKELVELGYKYAGSACHNTIFSTE